MWIIVITSAGCNDVRAHARSWVGLGAVSVRKLFVRKLFISKYASLALKFLVTHTHTFYYRKLYTHAVRAYVCAERMREKAYTHTYTLSFTKLVVVVVVSRWPVGSC